MSLTPNWLYMTTRQVDGLFKWSGVVLTLVGAALTSLALDPINVYFLNAGSVLFLCWAYRIKEPGMIAVNAGLLVIYLAGTYRALVF